MKEYITELSPTVNLIWDNFRRIQHRPLTECEKAYVQRCEELHAEELLKFPYTEAYVERTVAAAAAAPPDQKTPPSSRIEHKDATTNIDSSDSEDEPINYESAIHDDQTAPCFDEYGHELWQSQQTKNATPTAELTPIGTIETPLSESTYLALLQMGYF